MCGMRHWPNETSTIWVSMSSMPYIVREARQSWAVNQIKATSLEWDQHNIRNRLIICLSYRLVPAFMDQSFWIRVFGGSSVVTAGWSFYLRNHKFNKRRLPVSFRVDLLKKADTSCIIFLCSWILWFGLVCDAWVQSGFRCAEINVTVSVVLTSLSGHENAYATWFLKPSGHWFQNRIQISSFYIDLAWRLYFDKQKMCFKEPWLGHTENLAASK